MAFYLFPGVMYQRFKETFRHSSPSFSLHAANKVYDLACRQYLGFGFLFQFIPGTQANKARQQFSNKLGPAIEEGRSEILNNADRGTLYRYGTFARLYSYLNVAPLLAFISLVVNGFRLGGMARNKGFFSFNSPLPYSKSEDFGLSWLTDSYFNPLQFAFILLDFLHMKAYGFFDLGTTVTQEKSSLPRIFLKGVAGLVFGLLKTPLIAAYNLTLLAQALIETLIISPIVHFGTSFKEAYSNPDEKVLLATVKELQDVKELRRTVKGRDDCSYTVMKSMKSLSSREYIGIEKEKLYSSAAKPEKLVAIQGSAEKINKSAALLSIVNSYSAKQKIAKDEIEAVEEARSVLNVGM